MFLQYIFLHNSCPWILGWSRCPRRMLKVWRSSAQSGVVLELSSRQMGRSSRKSRWVWVHSSWGQLGIKIGIESRKFRDWQSKHPGIYQHGSIPQWVDPKLCWQLPQHMSLDDEYYPVSFWMNMNNSAARVFHMDLARWDWDWILVVSCCKYQWMDHHGMVAAVTVLAIDHQTVAGSVLVLG